MQVKIFTKVNCPKCANAKLILSELADRGLLSYEEISTTTQEGMAEALKLNILSVPVIVFEYAEKGASRMLSGIITKEKIIEALEGKQ
ncbi:MAG: hypothetical protein J4415_01125 [Candidatus Diapherotrites archaeon]|uniref:Glutaredoxin domain-containing protein n=1 Tax=Candidatus Iainarchaeum sp. TaxID=3101447 RepID=A0A8T4KS85_9ARCH|nr:hypothetical protein [Candidatus Diapherotrites archaeon]